jgi:hypothetical protein
MATTLGARSVRSSEPVCVCACFVMCQAKSLLCTCSYCFQACLLFMFAFMCACLCLAVGWNLGSKGVLFCALGGNGINRGHGHTQTLLGRLFELLVALSLHLLLELEVGHALVKVLHLVWP